MGAAGKLAALSAELADIIERAGRSVVRVDDGTRLTACGIVYNAEGVIVATSHGVERDEEVAVEAADGRRLEATVVGRDPDTDIAVLRVDAADLTPMGRADSESIRVGNLAVALGRPGRRGLEATLGLVSSRIDTETNGRPSFLLHTDADLFPGFSGGALIDLEGRALGMLNLVFGRGRGTAIGLPVVDASVEAILKHGSVRRGFLGVRTQVVALPDSLRSLPGADREQGLLVVGVESGSPADKAGVLLGDMLLTIGEQEVEDVDSLRAALRATPGGEQIGITVARGGSIQSLTVVLGSAG